MTKLIKKFLIPFAPITLTPHSWQGTNYVEIKPTIPESYKEAERQAREGVKKATREHTLDDFYDNMSKFGLTRGLSPRNTLFKGLENKEDNYILINNPESKKTHLRVIPKEVLDSLAYHHGLNPEVPMEVVYGLPEREGAFGGLNLMNIKDKDSLTVLPPFYMFNAWDYMTSPEEDILLAAKRKVLGRPVSRDEQLTEKLEQQVQDVIADTYRRDKKIYDKNPLYNPNMNIYDWAWEWFKRGKYNPGDPDYENKVLKDGRDIINAPTFKKWWEEEGKYHYLKGKQNK